LKANEFRLPSGPDLMFKGELIVQGRKMTRAGPPDFGMGVNLIHILPIGETDGRLLNPLAVALSAELTARCEIFDQVLDPHPAFHVGRQQYFSTEILARMQDCLAPGSWRLLGVTSLDLYVPILTFVFGEAQLNGTCALVSTHRLRQEFYGLPPDLELLQQRLLKEAVHELGHTLSLTHCEDHRCAMARSHTVEWIDLKGSSLCGDCRGRAGVGFQSPGRPPS
jgi:archaemetzincin